MPKTNTWKGCCCDRTWWLILRWSINISILPINYSWTPTIPSSRPAAQSTCSSWNTSRWTTSSSRSRRSLRNPPPKTVVSTRSSAVRPWSTNVRSKFLVASCAWRNWAKSSLTRRWHLYYKFHIHIKWRKRGSWRSSLTTWTRSRVRSWRASRVGCGKGWTMCQ